VGRGCPAALSSELPLAGGDGFVDRVEEVVPAELLEQGSVLQVVVDQVRGPGDPDPDLPLTFRAGYPARRLFEPPKVAVSGV
jgi:hypothetical protein